MSVMCLILWYLFMFVIARFIVGISYDLFYLFLDRFYSASHVSYTVVSLHVCNNQVHCRN